MEDYLQYVKALRAQMNDAEDQTEKLYIEEQIQITTVQALEKDLDLVKLRTRQLKEDHDQMNKAKGHICSQILEKNKKIASMEADSITLSQTLDLIQQEKAGLSAKLVEKRTYYSDVAEGMSAKLQGQQEWMKTHKRSSTTGPNILTTDVFIKQANYVPGTQSDEDIILGEAHVKELMTKSESEKAQLDMVTQSKSKLVLVNSKVKKSVELLKCKINDFKLELQSMDIKTLEEEYQALISDRDGEIEFFQSLNQQIKKLKGISNVTLCACGETTK
ncbi:uncharacterized protein LOC124931908 [Impatiens glandulifera]|uniref:uncharacterized protein LOC124931908 n=1 Tax=Impatiens glandulifera TaxID=253017 RepID=UPI001FB04D8D|nr:uncharacterized protein LOC124931908 [Impatiens glandulifera]